MDSIIEAALENAARESSDADPDGADEFGPPRAAVVGCGESGARRVAAVTSDYRDAADSRETLVRSVAIEAGDQTTLDGIDERCPWEGAGDHGPVGAHAESDSPRRERFASLLQGTDLQVLTGDLGSPVGCRLLARTCAVTCEQRGPTVVVPTLPDGPLEDRTRETLAALRRNAGCILPVDPGRLPADSPQEVAASAADDVAISLLSAVLGLVSGSMALPVDLATVHDLLETGGVGIPFVGTVGYKSEEGGHGVEKSAVRRSLQPCYDGAGGPLGGRPVGWLSYLVAGPNQTLREAHHLETVLSSVLVDDADVPSASSGHIDEAITTEGHLTALVFTE